VLVEHLQGRQSDSLAQFCINVATDFYSTAVIREQALVLSKQWSALASKKESAGFEKQESLATEERLLRALMIQFLAGLSDALAKRNDPAVLQNKNRGPEFST
jgi:hypothetical protein